MREQAPEQQLDKNGFGGHFFAGLLWGWAFAATYLTRYDNGIRGHTRFGTHAIFAIGLYAIFAPCEALYLYWLLFCVVGITKTIIARFRKHKQFSFYEGDFILRLVLPFIPEGFAKAVLEPATVILVGYWLKQFDRNFGLFFIIGGGLAAARATMEQSITRAKDIGWEIMREQLESDRLRRQARGR